MKRQNFTLIIILIILIVIAYLLTERPGEKTLKDSKTLVELDTSKIDKIWILNEFGEIQVERKPDGWMVTKPLEYPASIYKINSALMQLDKINIISEATRKKERFHVYGIDSNSVQIKIYSKGKMDLHLIIGNNADNPMETFVKKQDEDIIYLVKAPLSFIFNVPLKDWRLRTIIDLANNKPKEILFRDKKESFTLTFTDSLWKIQNILVDSSSVLEFISRLSPLETDFFEDEKIQLPELTYQIMIDKNILINIYNIDEDRYYLTTNQKSQIFIILKSKALALMKKKNDFIKNL